MKIIKNILLAVVTIGLTTSCVNDGFETPKQDDCVKQIYTDEIGVVRNMAKTFDVSALYTLAVNPTLINNVSNAPLYIKNTTPPLTLPPTPAKEIPEFLEGYVVSSEEGGNFYKNMYIQPLDGSMGFNLSIDEGNLYTKGFQPGRKVFLKLNGLAYAEPTSFAAGLIIGAKPTSIYAVDRLQDYEYKKHLFASCDIVDENTIVSSITLAQAIAPNNIYLNKLVEISNVQFRAECSNYSSKVSDTSLKLVNSTTSTATLDLRTSKYASFAGNIVPSGNGTIRGVLTKYGSLYQIIIRTERDVKFTNPRVGAVLPRPPAKIGAISTIFNSSLIEDFSSYVAPINDALIPKYINQTDIGQKFWDIKSFGNPVNKYIQTQGFGNGCVKNYFIVPVNFTDANGMSFKTLDGFNNGLPLKVYYSMDYTPGDNVASKTLIDISSKFTYADGRPTTASNYASTFTPSGYFLFPRELTGNGYIIFEYDGTNGTTTTYQIDDIIIN
jgi:hypothetical protein